MIVSDIILTVHCGDILVLLISDNLLTDMKKDIFKESDSQIEQVFSLYMRKKMYNSFNYIQYVHNYIRLWWRDQWDDYVCFSKPH